MWSSGISVHHHKGLNICQFFMVDEWELTPWWKRVKCSENTHKKTPDYGKIFCIPKTVYVLKKPICCTETALHYMRLQKTNTFLLTSSVSCTFSEWYLLQHQIWISYDEHYEKFGAYLFLTVHVYKQIPKPILFRLYSALNTSLQWRKLGFDT